VTQRDPPEVTFGDGKHKINFKGKAAIESGDRCIRFWLFAEAIKKPLYGGAGYLLIRWS